MSSSQLTFIFFRGLGIPPTSYGDSDSNSGDFDDFVDLEALSHSHARRFPNLAQWRMRRKSLGSFKNGKLWSRPQC